MTLTVRLSPRTERALASLAKRRRQTRSEIVREAIERFTATDDDDRTREPRPYDEWVDVVGIVRIGGRPSEGTTGERFRDLVEAKARARRSR